MLQADPASSLAVGIDAVTVAGRVSGSSTTTAVEPSSPSAAPSAGATAPAPLVALVGWLLPGAGYLLVGERARGITIGVTILTLFVLGLLIAGVRVVEVPGYNASGQAIMVHSGDDMRWVMATSPISEIRDKPWAVPQVLAGPVSLAAAAASVYAARPSDSDPTQPRGFASHVRVNEIGSLYLSVAGLLNLMAIIDASHRAGPRA